MIRPLRSLIKRIPYAEYDTVDRVQMVFSNLLSCRSIAEDTGVVFTNLGQFNQNDGVVISKRFADSHKIYAKADDDDDEEPENKLRPLTVGDKLCVDVVLQKVFTYETHFTYRGETAYIYKFTDDAGNTITWKTSKDLEIPEGWTGQIRGTVKEHSEYRGDKQTVLTRCKIIEKEASA